MVQSPLRLSDRAALPARSAQAAATKMAMRENFIEFSSCVAPASKCVTSRRPKSGSALWGSQSWKLQHHRVFKLYQLVQSQILEAVLAHLLQKFRRDTLNFSGEIIVAIEVLQPGRLERLHVVRRDALNPHSYQLFYCELKPGR